MPSIDMPLSGKIVRQRIGLTNDFMQAGERYRSFGKNDKNHLVDNIVDSLSHANKPIQQRMDDNLTKADPEFGKLVARGLKL